MVSQLKRAVLRPIPVETLFIFPDWGLLHTAPKSYHTDNNLLKVAAGTNVEEARKAVNLASYSADLSL